MHRDIVTVAPPDALVIGSNDNCACQALIIPDRVLSVQGSDRGIAFPDTRSPRVQPSDSRVSPGQSVWEGFIFEICV